MSDGRLEQILAATYQCFTRHGVRRTTMDDIAVAAGMSRPAVYQYVRSKNDAYRRLAEHLFAEALNAARDAAVADGELTDRVYGVLATKLDLTLRLWRDSPHAAELLDASTRLTGDLVDGYTKGVLGVVADTLRAAAGDQAEEIAELLIALTRGLEADLTDPHLPAKRLRQGVTLLLAGLPPTGESS